MTRQSWSASPSWQTSGASELITGGGGQQGGGTACLQSRRRPFLHPYARPPTPPYPSPLPGWRPPPPASANCRPCATACARRRRRCALSRRLERRRCGLRWDQGGGGGPCPVPCCGPTSCRACAHAPERSRAARRPTQHPPRLALLPQAGRGVLRRAGRQRQPARRGGRRAALAGGGRRAVEPACAGQAAALSPAQGREQHTVGAWGRRLRSVVPPSTGEAASSRSRCTQRPAPRALPCLPLLTVTSPPPPVHRCVNPSRADTHNR